MKIAGQRSQATRRVLTAAIVGACTMGTGFGAGAGAGAATLNGLRLTVAGGLSNAAPPVEVSVISNLCLHVGDGKTPSPWLGIGPFEASIAGDLNLELRGDYQFHVESAGQFALSVNGTNVLADVSAAGSNGWSAPIRLRKGPNALRATLSRERTEEAFFRVQWKGRGLSPGPVPMTALTVNLDGESESQRDASAAVRRGRDLFLRFRCGKCHVPEQRTAVPEMAMDAPSFEDLGRRRRADWVQRWILDPRSLRPTSTMPRMARGAAANEEARAMAAWLGSLRSTESEPSATGNIGVGRALFETLQCGTCHTAPGAAVESGQLSLSGVRDKFSSVGWLSAYLQKPHTQFAWNPMPDFRLSTAEAGHLAAWMFGDPPPAPSSVGATTGDEVRRGKEWVEARGCLACHNGPGTDQLRAKPVAALPSEWIQGCLSDTPPADSKVPHYALTAAERSDLRAFGRSDRRSLDRHVPSDFARRWTAALRCDECHVKISGIPGLALVGEKLRPDWTHRLLSGGVDEKPRPWIQARMPAFPAYAAGLSEGLAAITGFSTAPTIEPPLDESMAAQGRTLVSAGGFSCVSCHAIGSLGASAVFEAPGVNFIYVAERLRRGYFDRWVRNPQSIDPVTKMPLYFDEDGNSALTDFFGGDGPKTLEALWHYIRQGRKMAPPVQ
ncbi:MAG: c-type cytochrome [Verrucomicrobiales bacterium]|nr:c-type cytochrome [Verrucomicrobiales bacterium]